MDRPPRDTQRRAPRPTSLPPAPASEQSLGIAANGFLERPRAGAGEALHDATPELRRPLVLSLLRNGDRLVGEASLFAVVTALVAAERLAGRLEVALRLALALEPLVGVAPLQGLGRLVGRARRVVDRVERLGPQRPPPLLALA